MSPTTDNEALTRTERGDVQLAQAGWSKARRTLVGEFGIKAAEPDGLYGSEQFVDYVLLGSDGKPLAIVEAKRSARDELAGKRQAADYADLIRTRFGDVKRDFLIIDHWKNFAYFKLQPDAGLAATDKAFPLLSVCADNLLLICSTCNEAPNKGEKAVYSPINGFTDWFHPYLRPAHGALRLSYALPTPTVRCEAENPADKAKAENLDRLLNLSERWTREFKAEYVKQQDLLRRREQRRIDAGKARHTREMVQDHLQEWHADLSPSEPHYKVHRALGTALLEPARLDAWHRELGLVR